MRILIAEDEAVSRRLLKKTLERWGYEVTAVEDGEAALIAYQQNPVSIVITDWMMPRIDGPGLVKHIRRLQKQDYVYIIMLTAKTEKEDLVAGMNAGADDFISKPFDKDELRVRIRAGERVIGLEKDLYKRNRALEAANRRMKVDLEAASQIQKALLPAAPPNLAEIVMGWRFLPCEELAGDILNVFHLNENELGFYMLDVSGHGVPAALLAVTLSRMLSPIADDASLLHYHNGDSEPRIRSPREVAQQLNHRFQVDSANGQYFTFLYGIFNRTERTIRYVCAGHPGIIKVSPEENAQILEAPSLPIGFLEHSIYEERELELKTGDRLYIYSDGIPEAENYDGKMFGKENMLACIDKTTDMTLDESMDSLLKQVTRWCNNSDFRDDVSLLCLEVK